MPFELSRDLDHAIDAARRAVEAAVKTSLVHFSAGFAVENKIDRSPVTAADRESEQVILKELLAAIPDASVIAEESGVRKGDPRTRWIVDPLDGTRGFTRGGLFWGPLVALEHQGEIVVGATALPMLQEVYWAAKGRGCWKNGARVRVSAVADWTDAILSLGDLPMILDTPQRDGVLDLVQSAMSTRSYGDVAGALMVLTGRADAWIEAGAQIWDIAPMKVLFEEAGGRFTDLRGAATVENGNAVASNGLLHDHVIAKLSER
jgi:histidinol-phosphatase